jgi:hypothetical protein
MGYDVLTRRLVIPALVGLSLVATARSLSADPVTVTAGRFNILWDDPTYFVFSGTDGFALNARIPAGPATPWAPISPQRTCYPGCAPGTPLNLGAVAGGESTATPFTLGIISLASIDGTQYGPFFNDDPASPRLAGTFRFDAPTIVLPPIVSGGAPVKFTAPFVFSGTASGFAPGDVNRTSPLFSVTLAGAGVASVDFETYYGSYNSADVRYTFEDASAVPEPASLVLFGTGAIVVAVRARLKRRDQTRSRT